MNIGSNEVRVTHERPVKDVKLPAAGVHTLPALTFPRSAVKRATAVPRANIAASESHPDGSTESGYAAKVRRQTVLQQHCNFWDRDNDGVIWPLDTYRGFYELGYGVILSFVSLVVIHTFFSYPTLKSWIPDPFFRIYLDRIHRDKHGSDTGVYDRAGRFNAGIFEEHFEMYSSLTDKSGLTARDTLRALVGQRCILDPVGWGGAAFEWLATWILLWPADGVIRKEDVRAVYDGSIFWKIAKERGVRLDGADPARTTGKYL